MTKLLTPTQTPPRIAEEAPALQPMLIVLAGVLCLSVSPILVALAPGVDPAVVATLRCGIAMVTLLPMAHSELRRRGRFTGAARVAAILAGVFLGVDYVAWAGAVHLSGAGVTTVLTNVQVVVLPMLALAIDHERPSGRFWISLPLMLTGVALIGGLIGAGPRQISAVGVGLGLLSGVAYGAYMYGLRRAGVHARQHTIAPVAWATGAAAVTAGAFGLVTGASFRLDAGQWSLMIALALVAQSAPWLLIGRGSRQLQPAVVGALMLVQPVLAMLIGVLALGEQISPMQWLGCLVTVLSIGVCTVRRRRRR